MFSSLKEIMRMFLTRNGDELTKLVDRYTKIFRITFIFAIITTLAMFTTMLYYEKAGKLIIVLSSLSGFTSTVGIILTYTQKLGIEEFGQKVKINLRRGAILDILLPPGEVDHRAIELEIGRDRWCEKYGQAFGEWIFVWQSLLTVFLFWFDRVVVKVITKRS